MRRVILAMAFVGSFLALTAIDARAQVPNMRDTVLAIARSAPWQWETKVGNGCFTEAVAHRLHQIDPNWGHLRKFGGQNQHNGHAVDAILHKSGYAVDIIGSSESPNATPGWLVDQEHGMPIARYTDAARYFMVPEKSCAPSGGTGPSEPRPEPLDVAKVLEVISVLRAHIDARVDAIEQRLADGTLQHLEIKAEISHAWEDITRMLASLPPPAEPAPVAIPCLRGRVLRQTVTLCPVQ